MEVDASEQLSLSCVRRTWDVIGVLVIWLANVGFVRSRIILYILYIRVG